MSSSYRSLHINTSREIMAYKSFPMNQDYPTCPNHVQIAQYFDRFVDHFGLRDQIRFSTEVVSVVPGSDGGRIVWVCKRSGKRVTRQRYGAVIVANGHHWNPRWPEPAFPGADTLSVRFLDESVLSAPENQILQFHRVVSPRRPGLYFAGLVQPLGAIMPLAEGRREWIADLLTGVTTLPARVAAADPARCNRTPPRSPSDREIVDGCRPPKL